MRNKMRDRMRNEIVKSLGVVSVLLVLGCSVMVNEDYTATPEELVGSAGITLPADINLDELIDEDGNFNFSTIRALPVSVTLLDENSEPIAGALITLSLVGGEEVTRAITDASGVAVFIAVPETVSDTLTLRIQHDEYTEKEILITNVTSLATIDRQIYTTSRAAVSQATPKPPQDSDGDGIPDYLDQFPYDANVVSYSCNEFTLAFEDTYPEKGDADFNDVVVALRFMELYNRDNKIVKIQVYTRVLAAGAGYRYNKFLINIAGVEYILIENTRNEINANYNTRAADVYLEAAEHELIISCDPPLPRSAVAPYPYDPFVRVQDEPGREVHLPFVQTVFTGNVLDTDGFPWGIVVPRSWFWPYELADIRDAYPQFEGWYTASGAVNGTWYNYPEAAFVYNKDEHLE